MRTYRDVLRAHQDRINRLNVYPVPDGDTGTNMALTLESVVGELGDAADMATVTKCISHGSLRGARGNSGVILSQILRRVAKPFEADAGGAGFILLLDALLHVVAGRPLPEAATPVVSDPLATAKPDETSSESERYEVMYFLEAPDDSIPAFRDVWAGIGDSIVVVGGDGIWNCHIHTDDIGAAVEAAIDCGRPTKIRVTDLHEQVEEERWVREAPADEPPDMTPVPTAVVAIATGDGIRRIFRSLGVQAIVAGGQSMNPSTAQILEAVQAAPADQVVVLPNNKNIIPVAEQVDSLTSKQVRVLKTKSITEGFAALMEYDPQADADTNAETIAEAA